MDKKELIITTAKDILIAAMSKDSLVNLGMGAKNADAQLAGLGERFQALSKSVESVLDGLKD